MRILLDGSEDVSEAVWDDAATFRRRSIAHHCMRFAASCLSIRKDSAVVSFQHILYQREGNFVIDSLLERVRVVDGIEGEGYWHLPVLVDVRNLDAVIFGVALETASITYRDKT